MNKDQQLRYLETVYGMIEDGKASLVSFEQTSDVYGNLDTTFTVAFKKSARVSGPIQSLQPVHMHTI